jgi:hypothetical protein
MGKLRSRGLKLGLALMFSFALVFGAAAPAQADLPFLPILPIYTPPIFLFPIYWWNNGIDGTVRDQGSNAPIGGIIVSSYETSTGAYYSSSVTAADGTYSIWLPDGQYRLQFRDPSGRYGEEWYSGAANYPGAVNISVSGGMTTRNISLNDAAALRVIARREGHPLTLLPGIFTIVQQKDSVNNVRQWSAVTNGSGWSQTSGLLSGATWPQYTASGIDPTGRFYSYPMSGNTWGPIVGGTTTAAYLEMRPAGASREITPSVPASKKTNRSANVSFTVYGNFSKSLANGKQIKILAVKGSTQKVFAGTIKYNKYSAKVKLKKGTWTLYALFTGNSQFAANDSLVGKVYKVK